MTGTQQFVCKALTVYLSIESHFSRVSSLSDDIEDVTVNKIV